MGANKGIARWGGKRKKAEKPKSYADYLMESDYAKHTKEYYLKLKKV